MSEVKNEVVEQAAVQAEESKMKLSKVYDFEGAKVSEIDFSGLENLTANDMIKANKVLNTSGNVTVLPETNLEYTLVIAASATDYPIEFYKQLAPRDAIQSQKQSHKLFSSERNKNRRTVGTPKVMPCLVNEPEDRSGLFSGPVIFLTF